ALPNALTEGGSRGRVFVVAVRHAVKSEDADAGLTCSDPVAKTANCLHCRRAISVRSTRNTRRERLTARAAGSERLISTERLNRAANLGEMSVERIASRGTSRRD